MSVISCVSLITERDEKMFEDFSVTTKSEWTFKLKKCLQLHQPITAHVQNQYRHTVKGTVHPEMFCELRLASQQNSVAALS